MYDDDLIFPVNICLAYVRSIFVRNFCFVIVTVLFGLLLKVREVSFDYRSCSAAPDIQVKNSIFLRWMHFLELLENVRTCANLSSTKPATAMPSLDRYILVKRCCSTVMVGFKRGANGTACDICLNYEYSRPEPLWNHCDTQSLIQLSFNYFNEGLKVYNFPIISIIACSQLIFIQKFWFFTQGDVTLARFSGNFYNYLLTSIGSHCFKMQL